MESSVTDQADPPEDDPFASLVRDHKVLFGLADAFEHYAHELLAERAAPADLARFCVFFREFGAMIHHEKEERIALAALSLHGYQPGGAPRAQLHEEHEHEHALLLCIIRYSLSSDQWDEFETTAVATLADRYASNLRRHLQAEEAHLYPRMRSTLTAEELASVERKLERFEQAHNELGQLDWLMSVATELQQKYGVQ
jgi:hemerythrin-like domain-containing protein